VSNLAMQSVIELEGLQVNLGGRPILKGLTASLKGRCIGLLGPNGAGKTTLLHTLLGFYPAAGGTARVLGRDIRSHMREVRALLGYMPESDAFIAGLSGVRFVRLMAELSGLPPAQAIERALVDSYSLGMKQLAKLAQALVHGPKVLFLDEPTNGLDPPARERMLRLIRDIRDAGDVRVILSSHLLRDVEECCEEVLVLKQGQIAVYCDLEAERRGNRKFLELEIRGEEGVHASFAAEMEKLGCEVAEGARQRLKLVMPDSVEIRDLYRLAAERQVQIRRLDYKRDSLEDIFLKAMEGSGDGRL
jgi:ABC-2 type transport system ATP-binding protein